jgi:eukaryotic-like serine/threonine-protein kinase
MNWGKAGRISAIVAAVVLLTVLAGVASFCVAFRAERRSNLVDLPDWAGRTKDEAEAQARALGLGFEVAEERHDPGVAESRVLQQEPTAGTTVRRGRTVRVVVSLGGKTLSVPSLLRQPSRQADIELRRQGLQRGWDARIHDDEVAEGLVIAQAPTPEALSVPGERVHLLVSEGPRTPRFVMPDLSGRPLREVQDWITLCKFRSGPVRRLPVEGMPSGTVVGQLPPAGWPIGRRDVVELTVAR